MWFLQVLFNKKLKDREIKYRIEFIKSNQKIIKDLNYINQKISYFIQNPTKDFDDLELQLFKSIDFKKLIDIIELMNYSANIIFVSRSKVEKMAQYTKKLRAFIDDVWMPLLVSKFDSFSNLRSQISQKMVMNLSLEKFNSAK